jgi:hypothetical protein
MLAALLAAVLLAACGDSVAPPDPLVLVALELPAEVHVDALRDSVRLPADLVYDDGSRVPLEGGAWSGDGAAAATLHPDGWIWTRAEGEFEAGVAYEGFEATTRVVVHRVGRVTLTFDDGWRSARTVALPALAAAGIRASVAVVSGTVGWDTYLDRADLQALHEAGWAFVSHSVTHADLMTLSAAEVDAELLDSRAWILAQGLRLGDVFIVPYHSWGHREREAVRHHYAAARGATAGMTSPPFVTEWRPVDPYTITALDASEMLRTGAGRSTIMAHVEDAIARGLLLDLMFHDIPPQDISAFHALVADLRAVGDRIFTWYELYPG